MDLTTKTPYTESFLLSVVKGSFSTTISPFRVHVPVLPLRTTTEHEKDMDLFPLTTKATIKTAKKVLLITTLYKISEPSENYKIKTTNT